MEHVQYAASPWLIRFRQLHMIPTGQGPYPPTLPRTLVLSHIFWLPLTTAAISSSHSDLMLWVQIYLRLKFIYCKLPFLSYPTFLHQKII